MPAPACRLAGKVCLLMGGGRTPDGDPALPGNGEAVALTFAREGAHVVVADVDRAAAEATVAKLAAAGHESVAVAADVSRAADVDAAVAATLARHGRLDILYNNVGIEFRGGVLDTPEDAWDRVHDVNLKGVFLACKAALPHMIAQRSGVILNVSSTASLRWTQVEFIAYNSSKAALNHLTRVMARQYAPHGVRCNVIVPGMMDTPHVRALWRDQPEDAFAAIMAGRDARCPMGRQGTAQDVANAALFLASDEASYVTGVLLPVDGALSV